MKRLISLVLAMLLLSAVIFSAQAADFEEYKVTTLHSIDLSSGLNGLARQKRTELLLLMFGDLTEVTSYTFGDWQLEYGGYVYEDNSAAMLCFGTVLLNNGNILVMAYAPDLNKAYYMAVDTKVTTESGFETVMQNVIDDPDITTYYRISDTDILEVVTSNSQ